MQSLSTYLAALAIGGAFACPLAAMTAALAQAQVGKAAVEGIARQPEIANRLQTLMIIILALIESLVIYALLVSLIILFVIGLPSGKDVFEAIKGAAATAPR
jgi:F-type H+-transporting ATPase subunit c